MTIINLSPAWWNHAEDAWQQLMLCLQKRGHQALDTTNNIVNWMPVKGGITNHNYQLTIENTNYFVQALNRDQLARLPTKKFVPNNLVLEKNAALRPWLVPCLYETEALRVFEWVETDNTSTHIFYQPKYAQILVDFLAVLHTNISVLPILDIDAHLDNYYQLAIEKEPAKQREFDGYYRRAKSCAKSFSPSKNCHNDLSPGNLLISVAEETLDDILVVDWEYACISDPIFDLAGICVNFSYNEVEQNKLIQNYSQKMGLYPNEHKFNKMKELYQLVNLLWRA